MPQHLLLPLLKQVSDISFYMTLQISSIRGNPELRNCPEGGGGKGNLPICHLISVKNKLHTSQGSSLQQIPHTSGRECFLSRLETE